MLEISVMTGLAGVLEVPGIESEEKEITVENEDWVGGEVLGLNVTGVGTGLLNTFDELGKESGDE